MQNHGQPGFNTKKNRHPRSGKQAAEKTIPGCLIQCEEKRKFVKRKREKQITIEKSVFFCAENLKRRLGPGIEKERTEIFLSGKGEEAGRSRR